MASSPSSVWTSCCAPANESPPNRITLLCKDPGGYQNVADLITRAWLEGQDRGVPLLDRSWLDARTTAGLIALSGFAEGDVGRAFTNGRDADALTLAQRLAGPVRFTLLPRAAAPGARG